MILSWKLFFVETEIKWKLKLFFSEMTWNTIVFIFWSKIALVIKFVCAVKLVESMTPIERLASLLAAICHDLDHPGTNQSFLIATSNPLAPLYQVFIACGIFTEMLYFLIQFMLNVCIHVLRTVTRAGVNASDAEAAWAADNNCTYFVVIACVWFWKSLFDCNKFLSYSVYVTL